MLSFGHGRKVCAQAVFFLDEFYRDACFFIRGMSKQRKANLTVNALQQIKMEEILDENVHCKCV